MRPPARSSPSSARWPNQEISSGSAKCCRESRRRQGQECRPIFGDPAQRRPIFVEIKWQTMGFSHHPVLWWKHDEREREHFNTSLIAHQRQTKESRRCNFGCCFYLLDILILGFCVCVFLKRKAKCILFNIYSDFLCWLAGCCCPFGEYMDTNSNQTPT